MVPQGPDGAVVVDAAPAVPAADLRRGADGLQPGQRRARRELDTARPAALRGQEDGPRPDLTLADVQWVLGHAHITTTEIYTAPTPDEVIAHVLAHHERQRTQRAKPPAPPAPGYRPEVLATLFGAAPRTERRDDRRDARPRSRQGRCHRGGRRTSNASRGHPSTAGGRPAKAGRPWSSGCSACSPIRLRAGPATRPGGGAWPSCWTGSSASPGTPGRTAGWPAARTRAGFDWADLPLRERGPARRHHRDELCCGLELLVAGQVIRPGYAVAAAATPSSDARRGPRGHRSRRLPTPSNLSPTTPPGGPGQTR